MANKELINELLESISMHGHYGENTAHMEIDGNKVLQKEGVPGLHIDTNEVEDGIDIKVVVDPGTKIENPVHLCFGMLPKTGIQRIRMDVRIKEGATVEFLAHCTFPNAVEVQHLMDATIVVEKNASYYYKERHVHADSGGIFVKPVARIELGENARFHTEFELLKGRVGKMDIDYETVCGKNSVMEMFARIAGKADDHIKIREAGVLKGEYARGVLNSHIAVKGNARAEIYNDLRAEAAYCRGHVDCKEIVQGSAQAKAVPVVDVLHPLAHITHEAAIGSVDSKQLDTLMARGLDEEEAVDLIIQGLLT
ncbi:MAG: SufB/SufD family protein [Spirochaetia bacterium]